ncbi:hypothetical protein B296_00022062 [Ensete ventricosum]|uniref:Uncharacterized protein n=1 Tax=Ensete ventricosum TaxID=4639 RepID=A0A426XVP8_ENSVE|nr:hypothetical protein B296_00022062 [Ensete ventricosum]
MTYWLALYNISGTVARVLHERPKEARRSDPGHKCLDDQRWMCVRNEPYLFYKTSEVWAKGLIFLLPHPKKRCDSWLQLGTIEEVSFELPRKLVERMDQGRR